VTALPAGGFVSPAPPHVAPIAVANGTANTSPVSGTEPTAIPHHHHQQQQQQNL